jgi:hypothetical protein
MSILPGKQDRKQRTTHWNESSNIESLIQHSKNKTLEQLRVEQNRVFEKKSGKPEGNVNWGAGLGPVGHRYVKDPLDPPQNGQPGGVIDMRHFIESANIPLGLGEWAGAAVEEQQKWIDKYASGRFEEDYKSNFLGVVFRNNYWKNDKDVSGEFRQFFQDYQKGQLKGFWPAMDKATAELGRKGAAGIKKLEQLTDFATDYATRMGQQESVLNFV